MQYDRQMLIAWLVDHEGEVLKPYRCSQGYLTIGVGRNLDAKGVSQKESRFLLNNDIEETHNAVVREFPWFYTLSEKRQLVVMDMVFNLGLDGFKKFRKLIAALQAGEYETAAKEMRDSLWAKQVKSRADFLIKEMLNG